MTYGTFDYKARKSALKHVQNKSKLAGSAGMTPKDGDKKDVETAGGGRVHIDVDSFHLQGNGH